MINSFINHAPTIGLIIFFGIFCYILVKTLAPKNKKTLQEHSNIVFKDEKDDKEK